MANKEFVVRNGLIVANNTTIHVTANSIGVTANSFSGNGVGLTFVNAIAVGGNTVSDIRTYSDTKASDAYTNSVSYFNSLRIDSVTSTSTTSVAVANSVKTAYDTAISRSDSAYTNAVSYVNGLRLDSVTSTSTTSVAVANSVKTAYDLAFSANTRAFAAQTAATAAYSNAVSYVNGLRLDSVTSTSNTSVAVANSVKTAYDTAISRAATAYSNAVSYVNGLRLDSVTSTSTTSVAVANSVKTAYDLAFSANTRAFAAQTAATAAYSNATTYASNASNLTTGTVPSARLSGSYTITASDATSAAYLKSGATGSNMVFTGVNQIGVVPTYLWGGDGTYNYLYESASFARITGANFTGRVYATSSVSYGLYGGSTITTGIYGTSSAGYGIYGTSTASYGVYGTSSVSPGIYGTSSADYGIYGRSTSAGSGGVIGVSASASKYGILGYNNTWSLYGIGDVYTNGQILAEGNITAYYSDRRLKTDITPIYNAMSLLSKLNGVYYKENALAKSFGYNNDNIQIGVLAQEVQAVIPDAVSLAPFDIEMVDGKPTSKSGENYLTVKYEKIVPLLIEAIKEQQKEIEMLKSKIGV